jgi:hypothetical protein
MATVFEHAPTAISADAGLSGRRFMRLAIEDVTFPSKTAEINQALPEGDQRGSIRTQKVGTINWR